MIVHDNIEQGSVEWQILRSGIPTASEFSDFLTSDFELRDGKMIKTYIARKLSEAWIGGPLASLNVFDMEQGHILEEEAVPWFELEYNTPVQRVAFVTTDDGRIGCSPDGLIGDDFGIEIKCPRIETHVGYLLAGKLPTEYAAQVHGSMFVTGRKEWRFLSYCRRMPKLVLTIQRDEEIQKKLAESLAKFLTMFDEAMARLTKINGGRPKVKAPDFSRFAPKTKPFQPSEIPS